MNDDRTDRHLIIGAGPAGLAAMRSFLAAAIPFDAVEAHSDVGGIWDPANPGSPIYESAHFISSKQWSAYSDFPFPGDYPDYPDHRRILEYLRAYARHHQLYPEIQFGLRVVQAEPASAGGWIVEFDQQPPRHYRGLVVCPGFQRVPNLITLPGTFTGEVIHSQRYRSRKDLDGRKVLVVGAGNTAVDIACDAALAADRAYISMRQGHWIFPKHIGSVPIDYWAMDEVPDQELLADWLDSVVGDLTRFGLPKPDHLPLTYHPIVNSQILHYISHGNLVHKPKVVDTQDRVIRFQDGTAAEIDLVILGTGYLDVVPFISTDYLSISGPEADLFFLTFHRTRNDIFVSGLANLNASGYYDLNSAGDLIANHIRLEQDDPARFRALRKIIEHDSPDLTNGFTYVDRPGHGPYVNSAAVTRYAERLAEDLDLTMYSFTDGALMPAERWPIPVGQGIPEANAAIPPKGAR